MRFNYTSKSLFCNEPEFAVFNNKIQDLMSNIKLSYSVQITLNSIYIVTLTNYAIKY